MGMILSSANPLCVWLFKNKRTIKPSINVNSHISNVSNYINQLSKSSFFSFFFSFLLNGSFKRPFSKIPNHIFTYIIWQSVGHIIMQVDGLQFALCDHQRPTFPGAGFSLFWYLKSDGHEKESKQHKPPPNYKSWADKSPKPQQTKTPSPTAING